MRDQKRIPVILDKIKEIWELYPDLRFFQLLNAVGFDSREDYFFLEDNILLEQLESELKEWKIELAKTLT